MSLTPENVPPDHPFDPPVAEIQPPPPDQAPPRRWPGRLLTICFAIFALEVGLFLIVFPWQDNWSFNYFQGLIPAFENFWDEPYFRGAVTGLGFVNIYIACLQIVRLFRRP